MKRCFSHETLIWNFRIMQNDRNLSLTSLSSLHTCISSSSNEINQRFVDDRLDVFWEFWTWSDFVCHLLTIQTIVISNKIAVKNRSEIDMINEKTWLKLKKSLLFRKDDKKLRIIFEHCYFSYEGEIVSAVVQAEQIKFAVQDEESTSKDKKKVNTNLETIIIQLNREANVREIIRFNLDTCFDALLKMWRCKKSNDKNYDRHCWINSDTNRHISIIIVKFTTWQKVIDSSNDIVISKKSSKTIRELLLKKKMIKKKNWKKKKSKEIMKRKTSN